MAQIKSNLLSVYSRHSDFKFRIDLDRLTLNYSQSRFVLVLWSVVRVGEFTKHG